MTQQNTDPSAATDGPPVRDVPAGVNLHDLLMQVLFNHGVLAQQAQPIAAAFDAALADVEVMRDEAGRIWGRLPTHDHEGNLLPFDSRNVAALEATAGSVLALSPEAVAVFAGVVYPSAFREAKIHRLCWLGRSGEVVSVPDIFNSIDAMTMLMEVMYVRLQQKRQFEQKQLGMILAQQKEAHESAQRPGPAPEGQTPQDGEGSGQPAGGQGD